MSEPRSGTPPKGSRAWRWATTVELAVAGSDNTTIAREIGVSTRHVRRLLASAAIRHEIRLAEEDRLRRIGRRAASLSDHMLTVLTMVAADKAMPPGARVAAASRVLDICVHQAQLVLMQDRIDELERRLQGADAGRVLPWSRAQA